MLLLFVENHRPPRGERRFPAERCPRFPAEGVRSPCHRVDHQPPALEGRPCQGAEAGVQEHETGSADTGAGAAAANTAAIRGSDTRCSAFRDTRAAAAIADTGPAARSKGRRRQQRDTARCCCEAGMSVLEVRSATIPEWPVLPEQLAQCARRQVRIFGDFFFFFTLF